MGGADLHILSGKFSVAAAMLTAMAVVLSCAASGAGGNPANVSLVEINDEFGEWLAQADALLAEGKVADAVRAYQALLVKGRRASFKAGDGRYVSFARVVAGRIGKLDAGAMKLYRTLYDPQASRLFTQAADSLDRKGLREVANSYFHT